jgi:hypothetical protein
MTSDQFSLRTEKGHSIYCNVDDQSVAKERLGKQTSATERLFSMGSSPRPLLCNGSVDMFQQ